MTVMVETGAPGDGAVPGGMSGAVLGVSVVPGSTDESGVSGLPDGAAIGAMDAVELRRVFGELEVVRRRLECAMAGVVGRLEEVGAHRADGHASVAGLLRVARWSNVEIRRVRQLARLVDAVPEVGSALSAGRLGVAPAYDLARAHANPRVGDRLSEVVPVMLEHAQRLEHREFGVVVRRWESLVDVDGADRSAEVAHEGRDAQVVEVGNEVVVRAHGATGPGSILAEVFERFVAVEWDHDWAVTKEAFGEDASVAVMPRSSGQRRYDALVAIFERAAAAEPGARAAEPLVDLVVDVHTLDALLNDAPTLPTVAPEPRRRRCETVDGVPVRPADVVSALWWGRVRKVVVDDAGVPVAMGRRQRLFTGAAREAVMLQATGCVAAGCDVPVRRCQADHLRDWRHEGRTDPVNGAPLCGRHNRLKNVGFRVRRDAAGYWHTHRPDQTEIT